MQSVNGGMENNGIRILYEDDSVLVVYKPAGLIVHSDGRTKEPSLAEWVCTHDPSMRAVGEPWMSPQGEVIARPGIVHRLDRTTSGVLVLARSNEAHAFLKSQFQARTVEKVYDAFVYEHTKEDSGIIEAEIGRSGQHPKRWSAQFGKKGNLRNAITHWRLLSRRVDPKTGTRFMHLAVSPKTGRTHQIRVHLKAIHHPILCDHIYAEGKPCVLGLARPALHARTLTIDVPTKGRQTFESPLPEDMNRALTESSECT